MNAVKWVASASALAILAALLGSGCASYPISKETREQARQVTFSQVRADPEGTRGTVVIWGGRIVNVANEQHGSSIYIICLPSPKDEKPVASGPSPGRFIASTPDFLDPQMLPQKRLITVAGQLNGVRTEELGKMQYAYPVLTIKEMHIWPMESDDYGYPNNYAYYPYYPYGYYGPSWNWYWGWGWGPAWGWYYPYYHGVYYNSFHGGFHGGTGGFHGGAEEFHEGGHESGGEFHGGGGGFHGGGGGGGGGGGFHGGGGGGMGGGGGGHH